MLVAFIIIATSAALLWGLYQGTQAVMRGDITAGHLGQTVVYVIILASSARGAAEVYGDLLRAAGATERLMELLQPQLADRLAGAARPLHRSPAAAARSASTTSPSTIRRGPITPALRDFSLRRRAGRDGRAGRPQRRRQEHRVPADAALLRPAVGRESRVDGTPIAQWSLADLRARIGIVPQDAVIFSASALREHPLRPARTPATTR